MYHIKLIIKLLPNVTILPIFLFNSIHCLDVIKKGIAYFIYIYIYKFESKYSFLKTGLFFKSLNVPNDFKDCSNVIPVL